VINIIKMISKPVRKFKNEDKGIEYPNLCQSFHIGFNKYGILRNKEYRVVYESYNDVEKLSNFFASLGYSNMGLTDEKPRQFSEDKRSERKSYRDLIVGQFEEMMKKNCGEGLNPYSVNVVSFSGHGNYLEGDAIAVIP
jgi:hypothetical protein